MGEYELRVIKESDELDEKINKLVKFTTTEQFQNLNDYEQSLLITQLSTMTAYYSILTMRVKLITKSDDAEEHI